MAACHSMEKHSVDVFIFIFFIVCFHKKIICFHSISFEYSHLVTSTNATPLHFRALEGGSVGLEETLRL